MKIRSGFVSNSSTSSYVILLAEIPMTAPSVDIMKIKNMGYLYQMSGDGKYYFGKEIYDGHDDSWFLTPFEEVQKRIQLFMDIYYQYKDKFNLGSIHYGNNVSYAGERGWIENVQQREENEKY